MYTSRHYYCQDFVYEVVLRTQNEGAVKHV